MTYHIYCTDTTQDHSGFQRLNTKLDIRFMFTYSSLQYFVFSILTPRYWRESPWSLEVDTYDKPLVLFGTHLFPFT